MLRYLTHQMTTLFLLIGSVHLAGIAAIVFAVFKAPYGYEDAEGFHPRPEPEPDQTVTGLP